MTTPETGDIFPIFSKGGSVNHKFPSGPLVIAIRLSPICGSSVIIVVVGEVVVKVV